MWIIYEFLEDLLMAFFDNIGKKISQTGQMAVQKTKEMADVAKLNSNISDEEKKISNAFYQIGQLYVDLHSDDFEPDFEALITQLKESQNNVEVLKKQIQDIKGVKRCSTCGAEIPNHATFCSACGTAVVQQKTVDASNLIKCTSCGKMIEKGMKFCTFCGNEVVVQQIQSKEQKCLSCGAVLDDDVAFCTNCGKPVSKENNSVSDELKTDEIISNDSNIQLTNNSKEIDEQINQNNVIVHQETVQITEKMCRNCGAVLDEDSLFCTECGTKVE